MSKLLWGGRIPNVKEDVVKFTSSIKGDQKLLKAVIAINQAHVIMLMEQKIIQWADGVRLLQALSKLTPEMELDPSLEDVHMVVEEKILEICGQEVGGNLHIAKSRNDQVATAVRMELRENLLNVMSRIVELQESLIKLAEGHLKTLFPGYTHMQPAQPITFAHYLLSYVDCFERGFRRLCESYARVNLSPMGAGAIATSSFPINRKRVAELLGFAGLLENSIDAVSSRDFVLETMAVLALTAVDISRLVEDLILFGSSDFGLVELPDDFCSTSSIMPQKKNPDVLEVIRARMSQVLGNFTISAATIKALPFGYNLDFQEITPRLWESLEIVENSLDMLSKLVPNLKVREDALTKPQFSFIAATELANILVRKYNVPFRSAHKIVGSTVRELINKGFALNNVTPELVSRIADSLGFTINVKTEDLQEAVNLLKIVESHNVVGGPSPNEVARMLKTRKELSLLAKSELAKRKLELEKAYEQMQSTIKSYLTFTNSTPQALKIPKS